VAASRYSSGIRTAIDQLAPADQAAARTSLGSALDAASRLPADVASRVTAAADRAFVSGIHFAAVTGAALAACAALLVLRFVPRSIAQHGALHGAVGAAEDMAELGLAGVPPIFADAPIRDGPGDDARPKPGRTSDRTTR
jgi:hypothetical protein